ncbi:hypothetical protein PoB_003267600 [Plakobranchus ocellatus]|uniref:Uncharacterized protein n=1 Tax=Plakobranchus ocellatus TaxID=259542 RepID=A0AAV4ACS7_9GAST|nr:hypothetical protein PoB_003267600 [Plakobranchus ocellatus]
MPWVRGPQAADLAIIAAVDPLVPELIWRQARDDTLMSLHNHKSALPGDSPAVEGICVCRLLAVALATWERCWASLARCDGSLASNGRQKCFKNEALYTKILG